MTINLSTINSVEEALATITETVNPVVCRDGRQYPFIGEKGVRAALMASTDLRMVNAVLMFHLQTAAEQSQRKTEDKNRRGLMSSHATTGSKVIAALLAGVELPPDAEYKCDGMTFVGHEAYLTHLGGRYAKQLSLCLREYAIAREPDLARTATMFSVK